ncbi:ABC transporter ATP-binding protein [Oceanibacterium hippocampi]|uniref:Lipoprotein-releasing system ATP-binding protein LolD n=1 Tax=Oceanibacterium hippocampi TaxID=745714 RepID=A0A1Y5T4I8_9PROT|nr:ABC transporter ATP-binding protein [Oceanibacterium hippocampi]SLN53851.1 Lipoprotein-releasing system ATP-binding protein LolD [Oceanibacterium hippocampi]
MSEPAIELRHVVRTYRRGASPVPVLKDVDLALAPGEMVALLGPSGSGKSTLLHLAGLLEPPDGGEVLLGGEACGHLDDGRRSALRRSSLGFVYQFHHLLPEFSALENVMIPQRLAGTAKAEARDRAETLLRSLGLGERLDHRPARMSGGEQQRVAIARAIANRPRVLLADEPTGNLDHSTAETVFEALVALARDSGVAALVATHNVELARRMDRIVTLEDGRIVPV